MTLSTNRPPDVSASHAVAPSSPPSEPGRSFYPAPPPPVGRPLPPEMEARARDVLAQMTLEEKISLMAGSDDWHIRGVPRLGIPSVRVTDCGHGVTLCGDRSSPATCFPTGIGMAATWNSDLLEKAGAVLGRETRALGCSLLLGPMINLHRVPVNGRSFETFSEDPVLAGRLGAAIIRGIQSEGVGACVKAVAANNQQKNQSRHHVEVDERTLRELYLRAFEIAVREGAPTSIMTSYNGLNGHPTSENPWLLSQVIKGEWEFPGFIVSDWRAVKTPAAIPAGLDLEMPGPGKFLHAAGIRAALEQGHLSLSELDERAARLLRFLLRFGQAETTIANFDLLDTPEHRSCAQAVAEESLVLLKNAGEILPFDRKTIRRIAVLGPNAAVARLGGGGSASVTPFFSISMLEGLRTVAGEKIAIDYAEAVGLVGRMSVVTGILHRTAHGTLQPGARMQIFNTSDPHVAALDQIVPGIDFSWGWAAPGAGVLRAEYLARFTGVIVPEVEGEVTFGLYGQEGDVRLWLDDRLVIDEWDDAPAANFEAGYAVRYPTVSVRLKAGSPVNLKIEYHKRAARGAVRFEWERTGGADPREHALELARQADAVVICAGLSNLFEGGSRDRVDIELPGAQNDFIRAVAKVNRRTVVVLNNGGPLALPWLDEIPAVIEAWYPGQAGGLATARVLFGEVNPSGKLPDSFPSQLADLPAMENYPGEPDLVCYREGWRIGYRFFDSQGKAPQFPFGYGLSYTRFQFGSLALSSNVITPGQSIEVSVQVTNIGARRGRETVQLYVRQISSSVPRPHKELRQFAKIELGPGEAQTVTLPLHWHDLAFYHPELSAWVVERGNFEVLVGPDSQTLEKQILRVE